MHTLRISLVAFMISALARGSNLASGFAPSYLHFLNLPLHILRHGRHCLPAPFKTWEYTCMWQRRQGAEGGTVDTHPEWSLITPASSSHDTYQGLQIPSCGLLRVRIRRWRSANIQRPREVSFNIELYLFKVKQERGASGTCISGLHAPSPPQTILSFRVGWCPSQTRNTPRSLCQKIWGGQHLSLTLPFSGHAESLGCSGKTWLLRTPVWSRLQKNASAIRATFEKWIYSIILPSYIMHNDWCRTGEGLAFWSSKHQSFSGWLRYGC